jgi:hypothetical protein
MQAVAALILRLAMFVQYQEHMAYTAFVFDHALQHLVRHLVMVISDSE